MSIMFGERFQCPARYTEQCTPDARVRFVNSNTSVCDTCGSTWHYSCIHCGSSKGLYVEGRPGVLSNFDLAGGGWVCHDCGTREALGADVSGRVGGRPQPKPGRQPPPKVQPPPQPYSYPQQPGRIAQFFTYIVAIIVFGVIGVGVLAILGGYAVEEPYYAGAVIGGGSVFGLGLVRRAWRRSPKLAWMLIALGIIAFAVLMAMQM